MLSENEVAAIKSLASTLDAVALAGDLKGLVGLFAADCTLMQPNGPEIQGRAALLAFLESAGMKVSKHKVEFREVDGHNELAYVRGTYAETYTAKGVDGQIEDAGSILGIVRKQAGGSWQFFRWMWNSDLPLA